MTDRIATTPFGGGPFSSALFKAHEKLEADRAALKSSGNRTGKTDKWQFLRALTEARDVYALSDRAIAVLEALLSFHPEKELDGSEDIIVFPSNGELSLRTRGMSAPTLRRHIATLVKTGLLLRKDSANGKRFARKGPGGEVRDAFGFNLAPAALMAPEVFEQAEAARAHAAEVRRVRAEITLHLRDISKMIEAAFEDGQGSRNPALWLGFTEELKALSGRVARNGALDDHKQRCDALVRLRARVESAFLAGMDEVGLRERDCEEASAQTGDISQSDKKMSGNDARNERHIQNSNKDDSFEYCSDNKEAGGRPSDVGQRQDLHHSGSEAGQGYQQDTEAHEIRGSAKGDPEQVSLGDLKRACPSFADYALEGLGNWSDARKAAELIRPMLGISKDAWLRAQQHMGPAGAIVTMAYLVERAEEIKSAGGYLRVLSEKAEAGKFRLRPMLDSLLNR
ncbi:plasmid replication protein RepC [Roseibium alexandrii]|uniref:Replication protein C C-terminal region/Replication protein C N-terminal domain protein n=1 Tax=Roseibium alexandrii (strain DSM 17067 / NCIMB 14079 / DFL-11) TaxID=244592 RepID=A0A5E8H9F0_ROSAD|nr:plasmid replication protein RepC [Roseibium alexandrii]EEE48050.2 Replication protein C C-terminal region/Replication protein C N-terminal domain protein [Roseibium alexandrii DFL-11]